MEHLNIPPMASRGKQPYQNLNHRLPASRTVKEYISTVLIHQVCGNLFQQSSLMNAILLALDKELTLREAKDTPEEATVVIQVRPTV